MTDLIIQIPITTDCDPSVLLDLAIELGEQAAAEATMANALQGTILGLPVFIDAGCPALATGNKTVALISKDAYRVADRDPGLVSNVNPWAQQSSGIVEVNSYYRSTGRWMRPQSAAIIKQA